jgi:MtN3 and saliva related transmembrane protein
MQLTSQTDQPCGHPKWRAICKFLYMNWIQIVGLVAGTLTSGSLIPQLIKTIKEKKAEDVSIGMLLVLMLGVATWIVYGFLREDLPIIITNSFSLLLNITMIVLRFKYNR